MSECHDYSGTVFVYVFSASGKIFFIGRVGAGCNVIFLVGCRVVVWGAVLELHHGGVVVQDGVIDYGGGIEAFEVCGSEEAVVP